MYAWNSKYHQDLLPKIIHLKYIWALFLVAWNFIYSFFFLINIFILPLKIFHSIKYIYAWKPFMDYLSQFPAEYILTILSALKNEIRSFSDLTINNVPMHEQITKNPKPSFSYSIKKCISIKYFIKCLKQHRNDMKIQSVFAFCDPVLNI